MLPCWRLLKLFLYNYVSEKSIQFEDDFSDSNSKVVDEIIYRASDDIKVLPSCDSLPEPVHLVRNKSTPSLNTEKGKV